MEHQTFWKPEKKAKEQKSYSSLGKAKKEKKPTPEWKKDVLAHHQKGQSSKDRCEFKDDVLSEIIAESDGICPACKNAPSTTTHHVMPKGRKGRGVKTNGLRMCWPCHDTTQTNEELLQYWISVFRDKYGDRFWFDEKDWEEHNHKQNKQMQIEKEKAERKQQIKPVMDLLTAAAGRSLRANEIRLLETFEDKEMTVFASMMADVLGKAQEEQQPFGYGHFYD
ncbi:MAG: HNH endonuclease [Paenibacillus sp.]|nr:HNH endonuclease [Paenibacillus sp.]